MDKEIREELRSEILDLHVNKSLGYDKILEDLILKHPVSDMYEMSQLITSVIGRPKATKLILKRDVNMDIPVETSPFIIKYEPIPENNLPAEEK